jgi:hypothetical protein
METGRKNRKKEMGKNKFKVGQVTFYMYFPPITIHSEVQRNEGYKVPVSNYNSSNRFPAIHGNKNQEEEILRYNRGKFKIYF